MIRKWMQIIWVAALLGMSDPIRAETLYDGGLGSLPALQGWLYYSLPLASIQSMEEGAAHLDTRAMGQIQAGYSMISPLPLDRNSGFSLRFTVRVDSESHASTDRAGFSVIVITEDKRGIELGFWEDRVFAQSDSPLFTQAEHAEGDMMTDFRDYTLTLRGELYELRADGQPLLSGPLRDYSPFAGLVDPYETPNFIFLGDDTTSASGAFRLRMVVLVPPPVLQMPTADLLVWAGQSNEVYRVEKSVDLRTWIPAGTATSSDSRFEFTDFDSSDDRFFRVVYP